MYFADYHTHSEISPDSSAPLLAMADAAAAAGLSELCVTDHFDLQDDTGNLRTTLDWAPRLEQFRHARDAMAGRLSLRLGLELGSAPVDHAVTDRLLDQPELDFVIGSLHNLTPAGGGRDLYFIDYASPQVCYHTLDDYFTFLETLSALPAYYDVLGHVIYPLRYMCYRDGQEVSLDRYAGQLDGILRRAIQAGRGIELNTWCGRIQPGWKDLLARYRALGGEIITIGSDAHAPENVAKGLSQGCELLREAGFRYYAVYEKRRPRMIKL